VTGKKHTRSYGRSPSSGKSLISLTSQKNEAAALHFVIASDATEQGDTYGAMVLASADNVSGKLPND